MATIRRRAVGDPVTDQDSRRTVNSQATTEDNNHESVMSESPPVTNPSNIDVQEATSLPSHQFAHHPNCQHYHPNEQTFLILELSQTQVFCGIGIVSIVVLAASIAVSLFLNGPAHFNGDPLVSNL